MKIERITIENILEVVNGRLVKGSLSDSVGYLTTGADLDDAVGFVFSSKFFKSKCLVIGSDTDFVDADNIIKVENPRLAFALFLKYLDKSEFISGIAVSAVIADTCEIGENVFIGQNVVLEDNVKIGSNCVIRANSVIMSGSFIGESSEIYSNVTIYPNTVINQRVIIHAGSVIGSDGFGYERLDGVGWYKIVHHGRVVIGNDVEIGACTTIDRGTVGDTVISDGVKLDNQCQIGHNVYVGRACIISGCTGIAGSTVIGDNVMLGGGVAVSDHLKIASNVVIKGASTVLRDVSSPGLYGSAFNVLPSAVWNKCMLIFAKLPSIYKFIRKIGV